MNTYRVIADTSAHNLPIGATVSPIDPPDWYYGPSVGWYTQGGDGDEVAIEPTDLVKV